MEKNIVVEQNKEINLAERFVASLVNEFGNVGDVALTNGQKRLALNYFASIESSLIDAEGRRDSKYNTVPYTWQNVDLTKLRRAVIAYARIGLDPSQKNHLNMIPYLDKKSGKYIMTFIEGYQGIELKAKKYGLNPPDNIVVELVHKNDSFRVMKKDHRNKVESYEFDINPFDRGEIIGGFYYFEFINNPEKNKLRVVTMKEILKRKPDKASAEFWGGEKDIWVNGKKTGKETVEGWFDKMVEKTIKRMAFGEITIDPNKIDADYHLLKELDIEAKEDEVNNEIKENANSTVIDVTEHVVRHDVETGEINDEEEQF